MEILRVVGLALMATALLVIVRHERPEIGVLLSLAVGVLVFLLMLDRINAVVEVLNDLARRANINQFYLVTILKIIGLSYVAEFGAQVCRDAGENTVATRVEFAAKILVMVLALPIVVAVLESILSLLP